MIDLASAVDVIKGTADLDRDHVIVETSTADDACDVRHETMPALLRDRRQGRCCSVGDAYRRRRRTGMPAHHEREWTTMKRTMLDRLFSSYVSRTYRGDRGAFERIQDYFAEATRFTEDHWDQVRDGETEAVFKKGKELALTFDYRSPTLEVRSIIGFDPDDETITVTVGNRGFPGEVHLAKGRYQDLLDKIDAYIVTNGIAVETMS